MAILPIRSLGDPILRRKTRRVKVFDQSLRRLVDDMVETMRDANGVGLAANQVGVPLRLCVIEIPDHESIITLVNPEIIRREGTRELEEGCLSIRGYRGSVLRSAKVRVRASDLAGKPMRIKAEDNLLAQAIEHEIDHLNGVLYTERLVSPESIWKLTDEAVDSEVETESIPR